VESFRLRQIAAPKREFLAPALAAGVRTLARLSDPALSAGARWFFFRAWRRFQKAVRNPRAVQEARLRRILRRAAGTAFGREHGFARLGSLDDYRARIPIRRYEDFEPYLQRMLNGEENVLVPGRPFYFARSSGTTGPAKFIPVTHAYLSEFLTPQRVFVRQIMQTFPGCLRGRLLALHNPGIEGFTPGGTPYGPLTAALRFGASRLGVSPVRGPFSASPRTVFLLENFDLKYYILLRLAAQERISLAAALNPSTLVLLGKLLNTHADALARDLETGGMRDLERVPEPIRTHVRRLLRKHPEAARRIRDSREKRGHVAATDLWPTIAGLLCWKGGNAPLYLRQLETWYPGRIAMDFGFLASEGSFSIPLSPEGARGVTAVTGHLIEFVPEKEMENGRHARTYLADELETGARYRVLVTGSHGLYRYDLNDVVECVGYHAKTAEIAFLHKGGNMANLTGEKIGESHAVAAARRAEERTGLSFAGFCLGYEGSDPPRYVFGVELQEAIPENQSRRLLHACEVSLRESNIEYAAKRDSLRLGDPRLVLLRPGALERDRRRRVSAGAPDAQVKTRTLLHDMRDLERREGIA
jgi:hypothetical protein